MTLVAVGVWGDVYQLVDSSRWYQTLGPIQTQNSKGYPKGNDRGGEGEAQNLQRWGKGLGGPIVQRRTRTQA